MKTALMIIGSIAIVALVAAGSFWAGMAYQEKQISDTRAQFFAQRGIQDPGQLPGGGFIPGEGMPMGGRQGGFTRGNGTAGEVKSVDGSTISLSTAQEVSEVRVSDSTRFEKQAEGSLADLQPGVRILVIGEKGSDGVIDAAQITILGRNSTPFMVPISPEGTP